MVVNRNTINLEERINGNAPMLALVVDDSEDHSDALKEVLSTAGYSVETAEDGEEGLAIALELLPDVIITDTQTLKMDGPYLVRKLIAEYANVHPLGRNPFIVGSSTSTIVPFQESSSRNQRETERRYKDLTGDREVTQLKDLYIRILGANQFKVKDLILDYISSNELTADLSLYQEAENQKPTILLVEDSEMPRRLYTALLKEQGYNVVQARDGDEGLAKAIEIHKYRVPYTVLSDTDMPNVSGLSLAREIKFGDSLTGTPLFIAMSGFTNREIEPHKYGIETHIPRPRIELAEAYAQLGAARVVPKNHLTDGVDMYITNGRLGQDIHVHRNGPNVGSRLTTESGLHKLE